MRGRCFVYARYRWEDDDMKAKIAVMGAGAFGFAIAKIVGDKPAPVESRPDIYLCEY